MLFISFYFGPAFASELSSRFFPTKQVTPFKNSKEISLTPSDNASRNTVPIDKSFLQTQADSLYLQSERALLRQNRIKALALLKQALLFEKQASYLTEKRAEIYIQEGLLSQAVFQYLSILRREPDNQPVRLRLAKLYTERGLYREALKEYTLLQNQKPEDFLFGFEKALALSKAKSFNKAFKSNTSNQRSGQADGSNPALSAQSPYLQTT